jgi:CubicO group peptidase (beta-lactamase class C family)
MRSLVLAPVGMVSSSFEQPLPATLAARAASGHPWNAIPVVGGWHVYPEMAAAGLWTTAGDLARLGVEFLRSLRGESSALGLTTEMAAQMLAPPGQMAEPGQRFAGLGFFCQGSGPRFQCGHPGSNHGFIAEIILFPATGKGAVVMLNSNQGERLRQEIFAALGREYGWPTAFGEDGPAPPLAGTVVGRYRHASGKCCEIVQSEAQVELRFETQPPLVIVPTSSQAFIAPALDLKLSFCQDSTGRIVALVLSQGNQLPMEFRKDVAAKSTPHA